MLRLVNQLTGVSTSSSEEDSMTTLKSQVQATVKGGKWRAVAISIVMLLASSSLLILTGCGGMVNDGLSAAQAGMTLKGNVHGGQQPVIGATIQLYAAQATGYGASSVAVGSPATTDSSGAFTITPGYTCPASPNDQVYITSVGGNPGAGANANLTLMAALGPCSNLSPSTFINLNEVTTVASVYALSGFMADYLHVGGSSTNYTGLKNAFATANNLVNTATGVALTVTPAYVPANVPTGATSATFQSIVPQAEINTLANIIAACVNTNGVGGSSSSCANLFAAAKPSSGTTPADTVQAALDIALNPGHNVSSLFAFAAGTPPFAPELSVAPNDWTIALNFTGGGLGGPSSPVTQDAASSDLAIDANGNIWVSNYRTSKVTVLNNLGAPVTTSTVLTPSVVTGGYSGAGISNPNAIALDTNGNAWMANSNGTVSELASNGSPVGSGFSAGGTSGNVKGLAIDGSNNVWIASSTISAINSSGTALTNSPYVASVSSPTGAIAVDGSNNVWYVNGGNGQVVKLNASTGSPLYVSSTSLTSATAYAAIDGSNQLWVPQGAPNSNIDIFNIGSTVPTSIAPASASNGVSVSIDGVGHVWMINGGGALGISPNVTELSSTGSVLSTPGTGYQGTGTALISSPDGSGVDGSGNLWLANGINPSTVTEFVGIASPTITPTSVAVQNNKIGTKP
jgi:sugar lactone lactonase YvrE